MMEQEGMASQCHGDSKQGSITDFIKLRLKVDPLLDDCFGDHEPDVRREFVAEAVQEKLE